MSRPTCRLSLAGLPKGCVRICLAQLVAATAILLAVQSAAAATDTWAGSAGSTDWDILADWNTLPVSGDSLIFTSANASSSNTLTDTLTSSAFDINTITFNTGALAYTMTGNTFTLTGGITNSSTSLETFSNTGGLDVGSAAETFNVTSGGGNITITGGLANSFLGAQTLTVTGAGGLLTLGGYTLENNGSLPTIDIITGTGNVTINGVVADGTGIGSSLTYVGTGGQLTLSGSTANTFTGLTTVTSGALILNKTAGVAAVAGNLAINGTGNLGNVWTLANNQFGANTVVSSVNSTGVASLTLLGTTQTIAGLSSSGGGLMVANSTTSSGTPSPSNSGTGTLILTGSGSYVDDGWVWNNWGGSGTLALTLNMGPNGVQTLAGTNITYSGPTIINSGTLALQVTNNTPFASPITVNPGTTLLLDNSTNSETAGTGATVNLKGAMVYNYAGNYNWIWSGAVTANSTSTIDLTSAGISNAGLYLDGGLAGSAPVTVTSHTNGLGLIFRTNNSAYGGTLTINGTASATPGTGSGMAAGSASGESWPNANITVNGTLDVGYGVAAGMNWAVPNDSGTTFSMNALGGSGVVVANMAAAGTITFSVGNNNGTGSFSGAVDNGVTNGTLSFQKVGTGTQTLAGASTYTGTTTVNGGTLIAANATALGLGTGAVSVASGAGLDYVAGADAQLAIGGTLSVTSGSGTTLGGSIGSTATSAEINVAGIASARAGAIAVNIYGAPGVNALSGTNIYTLVNGASGSTLNNATYTLGNIYDNSSFTVGTSSLASTATTLQVSITSATPLANAYWTGGLAGATNVWAESDGTANSNWAATAGGAVQALVPGSLTSVIISSSSINTAPTATVLGANMTINNLTIADTVNGLGLNADGNTLTITPTSSSTGITMNAGVPTSFIGANVVLGAAQTWTNNSGSTLTVSGAISGASGLTIAGSGTIVLSGANTYTGATTVNSGTLRAGSNSAFGQASSASLVFGSGSTGVVQLSGNSVFLAGLNTNATVGSPIVEDGASASATLVMNNVGTNVFAGVLEDGAAGSLGLTNSGSGTLTLGGASANTYTGLTTVTSGALILDKTSGVTAIPGNLAINGLGGNLGNVWALTNNQLGGTNTIVSSVNTNSGTVASLTLLGTTQTVAGLSSPTGGLMVADSTASSGTPSPSNSGTGTLILTGSGSYVDDGWIWNHWGGTTGTLALTLNMASGGVQTLTGTNNTYSGATTINSGTLLLEETTTFGSNITIDPNGTLELMRTTAGFGSRAPIALGISGSGTLNIDNTGSGVSGGWVTFPNSTSTVVNFFGTINVNSGVLSMDSTATPFTGNPNLNVVSGGVFGIRGENVSVGALTGNGDVADDWSGDTAGHALTVGANNASGTFSGVIHGSQTGGTDGTIDQGILGLTKAGAGTEILNGSVVSTYSGGTTVNDGTLRLDFSNLATPTNLLSSSSALAMGGGTLNIKGNPSGTTSQTFASLSVTANTASSIVLSPNGGTSTTLYFSSAAVTTGAGASLNFNYSAGTTNGATVGNDIVVWNPTLTAGIIGTGYSVTDAGGTGFATIAGGDVVRLTSGFTPLPASGASSSVYYNLNLNSDTVTAGSLNLIEAASQSVGSLTIDTTAAAGSFGLGATTLSTTGVAITGGNTLLISGSGALGTSGSVLNLHNGDTALVTIGALISGGAGGLNVDGPGTTALTATNTYTGVTIIGVGSTLQIGSAGSLNSGTYAAAVSNNGTLEYSSSAAQTLSGVISGSGGITKDTASSTLALTNTNTFTGAITINAGTVTLPGGTNASFETGAPNIIVNNGGTLSFSGYNTFGLTASSMSAVTVNSGGTILSALVPASNYVTVFNNLTLNSGTVSVNGNDLFGGSWGTFGFGGTTTATGTSVINVLSGSGTIGNGNNSAGITAFTINTPASGDSLTISPGIQSSQSVIKQGLGSLNLNGASTYTGGTVINGGTVQITKATGLGTGLVTVNSGTALDINYGISATAFTNAITGSGAINLSAAATGSTTTPPFDPSSMAGFTGTVTINTDFANIYYQLNTPSGSTFDGSAIPWVVNNQISDSFVYTTTASLVRLGSLSGNGTVGAGSTTYTLEVGALGTSTTFSGVLENSGFGGTLSFSKVGGGTLMLAGVNTYTGTTSISGGTLQIGSAGSLNSGSYAGAIADNATLEYSSSAAQTLSGIISGSGVLAKDTSSSTLTLGGANTYTGGTSVSAGILRIAAISDSSTSNIGPSSGPTNNVLTLGGGTLQYAGAGLSTTGRNVSLSANSTIVLSGGSSAGLDLTGTLSDNSSGFGLILGAGSTGATLTLGGANTYLGATTVNSGTLNLTGSLASTTASVASGATLTGTGSMRSTALSVAGGGAVTLASANSANALTVGSLTLGTSGSNATLNYIGGVNGVESLSDLGTLTSNDVFVNITGSLAVSATPYTLLSLASATALNNFSLSNGTAGVYSMTVGRDTYTINGGTTAPALTLLVSGAANPAIAYWDGAVSTTWNDLSNSMKVNWSTDSAGAADAGNIPGPLTDVILNASNNTNNNLVGTITTTLGANLTINSLNVNGNRTNIIAAGNTLTINALADGNVATELPTGNPAGQGISILAAANAFTINSGVTLGGRQAWINNSANLFTVGGAVDGSAGLLSSQSLTLQNTSTGDTLISGAIGDGSGGGNLALLINNSGSGTVTLSGANTNSGNTTVSAGTLILANSLALQDSVLTTGGTGIVFSSTVSSHAFTFGDLSGSANLALTDSGSNAVALTVGGSGDSPTYSGSLSGTGSLTKTGGGTLTLSGANSYSGATTVSGGTLAIAGGSLTSTDQLITQSGGALTITNGSITIASGGALGVGYGATGAGTLTVGAGGSLSAGNGGSLVFIGGGVQNSNVYGTGTLNIDAGGLVTIGAPGAFPNNDLFFAGYGGSGTINLNGGMLSMARPFSAGGPGTFNFNGGTLQAALSSTSFLTGLTDAYVLAGGATIDTQANSITIGQSLLHSPALGSTLDGGLTKIGTGTLSLGASNTFTGPLTINAGTLVLPGGTNNSFLPGNPNVIVNNGGTLAFSGYNTFGTTTSSMPAVTVNSGGTILSSNYVTLFDNLTLNNSTISINGSDNYGVQWGSFGFGGTTTATGTSAINALSSATGTISIGSGSTPTFTINTPALTDSLAISVPMQDSLAVVKEGAGTVTLSAANIYTGGTTVSGGTLAVNGGSITGTNVIITQSGGTLSIVSGSVTLASGDGFGDGYGAVGNGTVSVGTGGVLNIGIGGGLVFVGGGGNGGPYGTGVLNVNSGGLVTVAASGAFPSDNLYLAGYGGTGTINLDGGILNVARPISNGAGTTNSFFNFNGGTLQAGANTTILGYPNDGANGGFIYDTTVLSGGAILDSNGYIANVNQNLLDGGGGGGLTKIGLGTIVLDGTNTYTGGTTVSAGTLKVSGTLGATTGTLAVASAATVYLGGTAQTTGAVTLSGGNLTSGMLNAASYAVTGGSISTALTGSGVLTMTGSGTLTVSGAGTFTGGTNLSAGTIVIGANSAIGSNPASGYTIVAAGDSITAGVGTTTPATQAWPAVLQSKLGGSFTVYNEGLSGSTAITDSALPYYGGSQYTAGLALNPNAVVIQLGTNDSSTTNFNLATTNSDFVNSLTTIVNAYKATANHPAIWLVLPPTIYTTAPSDNETNLAVLMPLIDQVAAATGASVIDNNTMTQNESTLYADGLHPDIQGAAMLGQNIYQSLAATYYDNGPLGTGTITLSGGTLSDDGNARTLSNSLAITGNVTFASTGSGSLTFDPTGLATPSTVTISNSPTLTVNNTTTIKEVISGTGFTLAGSGILVLSAANNYSGGTTIQSGTLRAGATNTLPTTATVTFGTASTGGTLDLNGYGLSVGGLAIAAEATSNAANQIITNSNTSTAGAVATLTYNGGASSFGGTLQDGGNQLALTMAGGALTLTGTNTYSGPTTIAAGTLQLGSAAAVQNSTVNLGVADGLTFVPGFGSFTLGGLTGSANESLQDTSGGAVNLQVGNNGGTTTYSGILSGNGSLTVVGGTLVLGGANTYTGSTTIQGGTLRTGIPGALPANSAITFGSASTAGTLDLNGIGLTVSGLAVANGANAGNQVITNSSAGNMATLTFNATSPSSFGGRLQDGGNGKQLALTVSGGALTLTGANTYSGPTSVSGGSLRVNGSLASGTAVSVNSGAYLGGSGTINGAVSVTTGGHLAPSVGLVGGTSPLTITGGLTLANGSDLDFNFGNSGSDLVTVTNGLTLGSAGVLNFTGTLTAGDSYPLIDYDHLSGTNGTSWNVGTHPEDSGHTYSFVTTGTQFDLVVGTASTSETWASNGNSTAGNSANWFDNSANWTGKTVPSGAGLTAIFDDGVRSASGITVAVGTNTGSDTVGSLIFNSSTTGYTLSGGTLILNNNGAGPNITVSTSLEPEINTPLVLADGNGTTTMFTISGGSYLDVFGTITEATYTGQKILLTGGGFLELDGANTYTGGTTVSGGTLLLDPASGPATPLGSGPLAINGASSIVNVSPTNTGVTVTVGGLSASGGGTLNVAPSTTLTVNQTGTGVFAGTLSLSAASSGGGLTVGSGTVQLNVASATTLGTGVTATVASGATLQLTGTVSALSDPSSGNLANVLTQGTGSASDGKLSVIGATTQTVGVVSGQTLSSSPTTYSGNTTVGDGTNAANLTATQILQNTLTINAGSTVTIAPSGSGIPADEVVATSAAVSGVALAAGSSDNDGDSSSDPFTAIQAAIDSGSISSAKGQQLENRIAAIERLSASDPGLDASLLEDRVLAALPATSVWSSGSSGSSPLVETGSGLLAVDSGTFASSSAATSGGAAVFAPAADFGGGTAAVPEPSTLLLAAIGAIGIVMAFRRRTSCCE